MSYFARLLLIAFLVTGSFQERLEALGQELGQSDDPVQNLAGKFVEIALLELRR